VPKKKKKNKKMYFDQDVQDAITEYNNENNPIIKNIIYRDNIAYALDKLVENIINTFKFSYFDSHFNDVKNDVVSFLVLSLHKYDASKGFKAFSYFSVVAKNYLIVLNNNNYKKLKSHDSIYDNTEVYSLESNSHNEMGSSSESTLVKEMILFFDNNIPKLFKKDRDVSIAYSIIELMKEKNRIENFNKKGLYVLIREMTGETTSRITKVINEMKRKYKILIKEFHTKGTIIHLVN